LVEEVVAGEYQDLTDASFKLFVHSQLQAGKICEELLGLVLHDEVVPQQGD